MPHDDWVRLWSGLGALLYLLAALVTARVAYWRAYGGEPEGRDDIDTIFVCAVLWWLTALAVAGNWFITHEPRSHRRSAVSDRDEK